MDILEEFEKAWKEFDEKNLVLKVDKSVAMWFYMKGANTELQIQHNAMDKAFHTSEEKRRGLI